MNTAGTPHQARDERLPWWLRRHVGWLLFAGLLVVVYETTVRIAVLGVTTPPSAAEHPRAEDQQFVAATVATTVSAPDVSVVTGARGGADLHGTGLVQRSQGSRTARRLDPSDRTSDPAAARARRERAQQQEQLARHRAQLRRQRQAAQAAEAAALVLRREQRADRQLAALLQSLSSTPAGWVSPVEDAYRITATFGAHGSMWSSTHSGVDLAAPTGTPVRAVAAGTVTFAADNGAYGLKVVVEHEDGTETWYAHLSRADVVPGQHIAQGAPLGAIGATGNVTGPHLHLELRPGGGDPVDPVAALRDRGAVL